MYTIYQVNADELDQRFLDALKAMFKNKEIEIAVYERDETAYLLRSPANRERLLNAIQDVERRHNVVTPEQEQFQ
ncbi:MAG: hypothetical protein ACRD9R_22420 [Pyrinomonadaceae bacterium]